MWLTEQVGVKAPKRNQSSGSASKSQMKPLTWNREEHHLLVRPLLGRIIIDRDATGGHVTAFLRPRDVPDLGISHCRHRGRIELT